MNKLLLQSIQKILSDKFREQGFSFSERIANYKISSDFLGWIGINVGNHREFIRLNVGIGVHCLPIMQAFSNSLGIKYRKGKSATYSTHLNTIAKEAKDYVIYDESSAYIEVENLVASIVGEGKPFIESIANLSVIEKKIFPLVHQFGGKPEIFALLLLQQGKISEFEEFSKKWLENLSIEQASQWEDFICSIKN